MHTDNHTPGPRPNPHRDGSPARRLGPRLFLGLALIGGGSWLLTSAWRADSSPLAAHVAPPDSTDPGAAWAAALAHARKGQAQRLAAALEPVDAYFDQVALPGIADFLAEFSGPIDSATFVWQSTLDAGGRVTGGDSARIDRRTREALRAHLGLPDGLGRAIAAGVERFDLLQTQLDNDLRPQLLAAAFDGETPDAQGQAPTGDGTELRTTFVAELQRLGRERARTGAAEALAATSARDFAWRAAGKESLVLLLQTLIAWSVGSRLTSAFAARAGLLAAGTGAAAATSAAGPPGWVIASGEIAAVVAADLTLSWLLERHAAGELRAAINGLREQAKGEVSAYLRTLDERTQRQRALLVLEAAKPIRGGA